ncbi:MAG: UvrD-helicase domain-containing protein [Bacteroidales bacterium]|nr:UvrD-helicase domain-containing protein [Bacteroidales bacterium]
MDKTFDPWQREAIEISGGRHLVLAPPGCGKTDILTERVVHAHAYGVAYSDMLCLTFTNRAAKGMAQRITDRTANPVPDDLFVGNIHRYCSQMLFNKGLINHNSAIIDEGDVENIIQEELCKRLNIQHRTTELMRYQHALWQLTLGMRGDLILHGDLLHTGAMTKLCDVLGMPAEEESLGRIYADIEHYLEHYAVLHELPAANTLRLARAYQQYKADNDLLDYDDLLILAYNSLSPQPPLLKREGEQKDNHSPRLLGEGAGVRLYRWIEIDEVQDLNALQLALVDLLAAPDATIVYLGDEQQAIFSFIGAKLETLETLKQRCQGHLHYLHTNYRSPKYLLDLQNDYAMRNLGIRRDLLPSTPSSDSHPQTPNSELRSPNSPDLCLLDVGDASLESYYAARLAKRYGEMDQEGKIAILVSTNREADDVGDAMTAQGIAHFKISGTDLFSLPSVRLLLAHLSVLTDEMVFIAWARLLWGLGVTPTYTAARTLMRDMRRVALLPSDFLLHPGSSYLQEFVRAYDNEELVIFDTETTGLDPRTDDIIQIAAVRVRQGKTVGKPFNIILETDKALPETIGGKPNPMLEVYRNSRRHPRAEGLQMFLDYCQGKVLVGHNVEYDYQILRNNLLRELGGRNSEVGEVVALSSLPTKYFDTLKYIRLVRPRLRHYKLGHLLETLHLEGQNSHQADDDILATLSLLRFCHSCALQLTASQRTFLDQHARLIDKFRQHYGEVYRHALQRLDTEGGGIVDELQYVYAQGLVEPVDKWPHLLHYLENDVIRPELYPTLRTQLERYITDLCTSKEADMCGGSLEERYIISTVHKAKGLEFDTVIIYRAIDGSYPASHSWTERQIQEDARRLFVALSRSRKRLCVLCDSYYGHSPHTLSPFLDKVRPHFTLYHRTPDGKLREG